MTTDPGGPEQRRRQHYDELPPYAPRASSAATDAPGASSRSGSEPAPPTPPIDQAGRDAAEEAAAYAEAREQGVLGPGSAEPPAGDNPGAADDSRPAASVGATAAPPPADARGLTDAVSTPAEPESSSSGVALLDLDDEDTRGAGRPRHSAPRGARRPPPPPLRTSFRDEPVRTLARGLGQLLITLGVVLLLFVVYEVYVTDLFGAQKQAAAKESMEQRWESAGAPPSSVATSSAPAPPPPAEQITDPAERTRKYSTEIGQGFANIYIPVFGADYNFTVVEGTTTEDLYGNPGHYDDTQYPGELGNFAVAGHRVSKGSPFNALGTLNSCDAIVIETQDDWFVYRVLPMPEEQGSWNPASRPECASVAPLTGDYQNVVGREITLPGDYPQVLPIPHVNAAGPSAVAAATQRIITLTTCHPQFSDRERMIIHGVLVTSYAKAAGFVPPELSEG